MFWLVTNTHLIDDGNTRSHSGMFKKLYSKDLLICKLTNFGESRSALIQTVSTLHAKTENVERGSKPYMAPEIILDERKLKSVSMTALKAIDIWALVITMFQCFKPKS